MLQKGQIYHRDGITYKVEEFKFIGSTMVVVKFTNQANNQPLQFSGSVSGFMSSYSLLPTQLELKQ